jgi:DNA modification methylase
MKNTIAKYLKFIQKKVKGGIDHATPDVDESLIHSSTFPHERAAIMWALRQERALLALSFGLGKTHVESEIARLLVAAHPGSKFLIVAPLGVRHQFVDEDGPRLGINWQYVWDDESLAAADTPFVITNYERVRDGNITPAKHEIIGVSLDEGSCLRSLGSKTSQVFRKIFQGIRYQFVATATPSPNNYKEIIYYADYLGIMDNGQCLTRFFMRNPDKAGDLQIQPQSETAFWMWVATWAMFLYSPADICDCACHAADKPCSKCHCSNYVLPELRVHWHCVDVDHTRAFEHVDNYGQRKMLLSAVKGINQSGTEKRATMPARVAKAREIVDSQPAGTHWLLWHDLEDERRAIEKAFPESASVFGTLDLETREQRVLDFAHGRIPMLATKPSLSGSGCNFQRYCHSNIFVGVGYKFHDFIQTIHRTLRFQQTHAVDVHVVYAETEQPIVDVLQQKWTQHNELVGRMRGIIQQYGLDHRLINEELKRKIGVHRVQVDGERFTAVHNDCVMEMPSIASDSIGLIHTSIPFGNHYEYTSNYEDFGHNLGNEEFFAQMDFLIPGLYRTLKPGRVAAIHVKDRILYGHQTKSGIMQVDPFSDLTRAAFEKHGFLYQGRRTIVTDVVRENASTYRLGWTEMCKDASKMGSGLPEYLLLFRKAPTENTTARADEPVVKSKSDYKCSRWQFTAHDFWRSDGNVMVPTNPQSLNRFLLDLLIAKDPYNFEAHVAQMELVEDSGMLPSSFMADAPESFNTWVWDNVNLMSGLNSNQSRRQSVNHMCPLPFDIVDRVIKLYSNPGDIVLDPFGGLGTVPYVAVKLRRRGYSVELNEDYFTDSVRYLNEIENEVTAPTLFDLMAAAPIEAGDEVEALA